MFIGHYAPAGLGASTGKIKLWHAFVAVQLVDIAWDFFVLLGIEHVRIVDGFTKANPMDLYHMPYTHSLLMNIVWAIGAGVLFGVFCKKWGRVGAVWFGALVLTHWFADLIMHSPDMTLWPGASSKYGFGLWNMVPLCFFLEVAIFALGMFLYLKNSQPKGRMGRIWPIVFIGLAVAMQYTSNFGALPSSSREMVLLALLSYTLLTLGAWYVDRVRVFKR